MWTKLKDRIFNALLTEDRVTAIVRKCLNRLLAKIHDKDRAAVISDLVSKCAEAIRSAFAFVKDENLKTAFMATADLVAEIAKSVADCVITVEESDTLQVLVSFCVHKWFAVGAAKDGE